VKCIINTAITKTYVCFLCSPRHKNRNHHAVCQNVKYIMLHIRDCPGTLTVYPPLPTEGDIENKGEQATQPHEDLSRPGTGFSASITQGKDDSTNDNKTDDTNVAQPPPSTEHCPFPWCRPMKHLLHHLINCSSGRACRMCHPKAISDNMATLTSLNSHRRQKRRLVLKAAIARGSCNEAIAGAGRDITDSSAANGASASPLASVSTNVAVNARATNSAATATKPMPQISQAPQQPTSFSQSQPPAHQPLQRRHVPPVYPPQQQTQSLASAAAGGRETMQIHSAQTQSLQHPGSIIAQGRSSVAQSSVLSHQGSCIFLKRSQHPAAPLPINQGAPAQVSAVASSLGGLQLQTSSMQGGNPVVTNVLTQQCPQQQNQQQQQYTQNQQQQQKINSQLPHHPQQSQNRPIPQPQSAQQHVLEAQELPQNPPSQPQPHLLQHHSQQHQQMQPRQAPQTVLQQQQQPLKAEPMIRGQTIPPSNHQAAARDPPPKVFPVAPGSAGVAPPSRQLEPTHHNFHFLPQRSGLGHRRANSLPSLALAGTSAGLRPFDFANIMTARPLGIQQMPVAPAPAAPAPVAAAPVAAAPAALPIGTPLSGHSVPQFCGSSAPKNNATTAFPAASHFPALHAASGAATTVTGIGKPDPIRGALSYTTASQTNGQGNAIRRATTLTSATPTAAFAPNKGFRAVAAAVSASQAAAQNDPANAAPVSNPSQSGVQLASKNASNARTGQSTASIHDGVASSAIPRMETTLFGAASEAVSDVTSAAPAWAQTVLSQVVSGVISTAAVGTSSGVLPASVPKTAPMLLPKTSLHDAPRKVAVVMPSSETSVSVTNVGGVGPLLTTPVGATAIPTAITGGGSAGSTNMPASQNIHGASNISGEEASTAVRPVSVNPLAAALSNLPLHGGATDFTPMSIPPEENTTRDPGEQGNVSGATFAAEAKAEPQSGNNVASGFGGFASGVNPNAASAQYCKAGASSATLAAANRSMRTAPSTTTKNIRQAVPSLKVGHSSQGTPTSGEGYLAAKNGLIGQESGRSIGGTCTNASGPVASQAKMKNQSVTTTKVKTEENASS
jgi:hypothetical protein